MSYIQVSMRTQNTHFLFPPPDYFIIPNCPLSILLMKVLGHPLEFVPCVYEGYVWYIILFSNCVQ